LRTRRNHVHGAGGIGRTGRRNGTAKAADVVELIVQEDPVQIGLGVTTGRALIRPEKARHTGIYGTVAGCQVGEATMGSSCNAHQASRQRIQHATERTIIGAAGARVVKALHPYFEAVTTHDF